MYSRLIAGDAAVFEQTDAALSAVLRRLIQLFHDSNLASFSQLRSVRDLEGTSNNAEDTAVAVATGPKLNIHSLFLLLQHSGHYHLAAQFEVLIW